MSASLVGSEMCIRDRNAFPPACASPEASHARGRTAKGRRQSSRNLSPVSYTHLTLPTICSV
eukprot:12651752-Alexandrium_andersonii.AAC.1